MERDQTLTGNPGLQDPAEDGVRPVRRRVSPGAIIRRILLALPFWWVVSEGQWAALPVGLAAVVAAAALSLYLLPRIHYPPRPLGLLFFIGWFLLHSARAGLCVAGSILYGRPAVDPVLVRLRLSLPPGGPRWLLADVLGMMPGTLCVALEDDLLTLHCLNGDTGIAEEVAVLQARIARLMGLPEGKPA